MAVRSKGEAADVRALARRMFFSGAAAGSSPGTATAAEARCVARPIAAELASRERNRRERLFRKAAFPQARSFEGHGFPQVSFPEGHAGADLMSLSFAGRAEDFVFLGPTGRGKTHLAIAVGAACAGRGTAVRLFTAARLALALTRAARQGGPGRLTGEIARCDLLILDEFGYVPIDVEGARLLFQVMSGCHGARSMPVATNIEFAKWGVVLGDDKLAAAAIDRPARRGRLVEFGGASRRMEEALMLGRGARDEDGR